MDIIVLRVKEEFDVVPSAIPDKEYEGLWNGNEIVVKTGDTCRYVFITNVGLRGKDIRCKVIVNDGKITVTTLDEKFSMTMM